MVWTFNGRNLSNGTGYRIKEYRNENVDGYRRIELEFVPDISVVVRNLRQCFDDSAKKTLMCHASYICSVEYAKDLKAYSPSYNITIPLKG